MNKQAEGQKGEDQVEGGEGEQQIDPEIESEARENGWNPDKYKKDDPRWVSAEDFVKKGREIAPILQKNNERLRKELDAAKKKLADLDLTTRQFAEKFARMEENAYTRAIADLKTQRREALKENDVELAEELGERLDELKVEQAKVGTVPKKEEPAKPDLSEFYAWQRENPWYDEGKEPDMFDMAEAFATRLSKNEPTLQGRAFLDKLTDKIKEKFPAKFENKRREKAPHEGGGGRGETKGGKTYANLPAEAKKACDKMVSQGKLTQEDYVKYYEWD